MSLTDLKYTPKEQKEEAADRVSPVGTPSEYPWGLCITIDSETLDKLKITDMPGVGDEWHMNCVAVVTSVNRSASQQEDETRVGLQITMMDVTLRESAADEKAEGEQTPAKEQAEAKRSGNLLMGY